MQQTKAANGSVLKKAVISAMRLLDAAGCKYGIVEPDGTTHGGLHVKVVKKHRDPTLPSVGKYVEPFVKDLKPGQVATIPVPEDIPITRLASGLTAYVSTRWGKGSYESCMSKDRKSYEILRVS